MATSVRGRTEVVIEQGRRRVFAASVDWPGWCRSGSTVQDALDALVDYAPRYAEALSLTGLVLPATAARALEVVESVPGTATTDFGAPGVPAVVDARGTTSPQARAMADRVAACWAALEHAAATAPPELRKGPRGGGRDRDEVVRHSMASTAACARKIGVRRPTREWEDPDIIPGCREALIAALATPSDGTPMIVGGWPPRLAARFIGWHLLDHAWEIEDRSTPV